MNKLIKNPFADMQKVAMIVLCIVLAGILSSCTSKSEEVDEIVTDPETAILGKWELVLLANRVGVEDQKYTPTGYVEYLPEGCLGWYDYATKEYTLFEQKYWLYKEVEMVTEDISEEYWVLQYETPMKEVEYTGEIKTVPVGPFHFYNCPDKPVGNKFQLKFTNQNTISLYCWGLYLAIKDADYIYKRKK